MTGLDPGIPVVTATVVDPDTRFDNEIAVPPSASAAAAVTSNSVPPAYVPASTVEGSKIASSTKKPSTPVTTTTTTTTTTTASRPANLGRSPTGFKCPFCQQEQVTTVREQIDACTIVAIVLLLLFFWPLFWLPLCMPSCKTVEHYCGRCNRKVGETQACA
mmetsp:Transcript_29883/g.88819  ORF Transcript_29883/g.88819 Transcript_29883/m.88819 type:complete len:161 (-) Transcript_29883:333-815(-)